MPLPLLPILARAAGALGKSGVGRAVGSFAKDTAKGGFKGAAGKAIAANPKHAKLLKAGAFATGALTESMKKLNSSLNQFMQVNERLAVVNSNFSKESSRNAASLKGAEQGYGLAAKAMTEFRILGFKDANKGMIDLATRMKISGQNTGKMMKSFQGLLGKGGVNEKNLGGLAETITQTSLKYGVTTDGLIGALDNLSSSLLDSNLTGGTAAIAAATAKMVGLVGDANADSVKNFMRLVSSSKKEDIDVTSRLGIEGFGDDLAKGIVPSITQIKDALSKASNATRSMIGKQGADGQRRTIDALREVMGETGPLAVSLQNAIGANQPKAEGIIDNIKNTFEHLKVTFLAPFQMALAEMGPSFKSMTKGLFMMGGSVLNFVGAFSPLLIVVMDIVGGVARIFAAIIQAFSMIVDAIFAVLHPVSTAWNWVVGREKEDAPSMGMDKLGANNNSLNQAFGIESTVTRSIDSTNNLNKSLSTTSNNLSTHTKTSQMHITHTKKLTSTVGNVGQKLAMGNPADGAVPWKKVNPLGNNTTNTFSRMAYSLENLIKLEEEKRAMLIKQNMLDTTLANKDIDDRLFKIADLVARENSGSWDQYAKSMARDINLLVQPVIDTSRNTVPQPVSQQPNVPQNNTL